MAYNKTDLELFSEGENGERSVVFIKDQRGLGEFIADVKPMRVDLNRIPIGKKFVMVRHDCDSSWDDIFSFEAYRESLVDHLLQYSKELIQLDDVGNAINT